MGLNLGPHRVFTKDVKNFVYCSYVSCNYHTQLVFPEKGCTIKIRWLLAIVLMFEIVGMGFTIRVDPMLLSNVPKGFNVIGIP